MLLNRVLFTGGLVAVFLVFTLNGLPISGNHFPDDVLERETRAIEAIDAAHKLPRGPARIEALKATAKLRAGDADLRRPNKLNFPDAIRFIRFLFSACRGHHATLSIPLATSSLRQYKTASETGARSRCLSACSSCGAEDLSVNAETRSAAKRPARMRRRGGPIRVRGS